MDPYSVDHLSDTSLLREAADFIGQARTNIAGLLTRLAEIDARKLYLPAGYPSMFAYCVGEFRLADDSAYRRIQAARTARTFRAIFPALADGRLNLTSVLLLGPYLTPANADELLESAMGKTKPEIEELLAKKFPKAELLPLEQAVASGPLAPEQVGSGGPRRTQLAPERVPTLCKPRLAPIAPERYAIQVTVGRETHDLLRQARELLSHQIPSGDLAAVLEKVIALGVRQLEKRKFAAADCPRPHRPNTSADPRHISAEVTRAVWARDGGQCTFTSESGRRCPARERLEFDHIEEVARGGRSTVGNLRLRCRGHNQYAAERTYGPGFMSEKRRSAEQRRSRDSGVPAVSRADEVVPWLRSLGCRAEEARRAAVAACDELPGAPLEDLVKRGISYFGRGPQCANEGVPQPAA